MLEKPSDLGLRLSAQIKQLRLERRWTREDLAAHSGVNVYTLKHFERYGKISLERLLKICQSLDIIDQFMRSFKPRKRVDITRWAATLESPPQRGRRRTKEEAEI